MATDFVGTNTDKIDKLLITVVETRTTLRICFAVIGIGFPIMLGLLTFLVVQSFSTAAKVERLSDQVGSLRTSYTFRGSNCAWKNQRQQ